MYWRNWYICVRKTSLSTGWVKPVLSRLVFIRTRKNMSQYYVSNIWFVNIDAGTSKYLSAGWVNLIISRLIHLYRDTDMSQFWWVYLMLSRWIRIRTRMSMSQYLFFYILFYQDRYVCSGAVQLLVESIQMSVEGF